MKERLVADLSNDTTDIIVSNDDAVEMVAVMSDLINVHDPKTRVNIEDYGVEEFDDKNDTIVEENFRGIDDSMTEKREIGVAVTTVSSEIEMTTVGSRVRKKKIL